MGFFVAYFVEEMLPQIELPVVHIHSLWVEALLEKELMKEQQCR